MTLEMKSSWEGCRINRWIWE